MSKYTDTRAKKDAAIAKYGYGSQASKTTSTNESKADTGGSKTMSASTYKKYEQNYNNYKKTGSYGDTSWMKQDEIDLFNNIRKGNGKSALSNGNYYYMDSDTYDKYGKNRANWKNTGDYGDTSWMNQDDLNAYKAIRSSQDDYTNGFDDFRYSLDDDVIKAVQEKYKSQWGDKYYYSVDDAEDMARMQQGLMPKYLSRNYDMNDAYDKWLYDNNLPYTYKGLFSDMYSEAYQDWNNQQIENQNAQNNYNSIAEEYFNQRKEGKTSDEILTGMYDSGNYDWSNFKKKPSSKTNTVTNEDGTVTEVPQTGEDYIADSISATKTETKNPNAFTADDLENYYKRRLAEENANYEQEKGFNKTYGGSQSVFVDRADTVEGAQGILRQIMDIDAVFDENAAVVGENGKENGYKKEYLQSDEWKQLNAKRNSLLQMLGLKPYASKWDVKQEYDTLVAYQYSQKSNEILNSQGFNKDSWADNTQDPNAVKGWTDKRGETAYKYINGVSPWSAGIKNIGGNQVDISLGGTQLEEQARLQDPVYSMVDAMTKDEKAVFNYLAVNEGAESAENYFTGIIPILNQRIVEQEQKAISESADKWGVVGSTVLGAITQFQQGQAGYAMFFDKNTYYNDPRASLARITSGLRNENTKDFSDAGKFWYGTINSIVDNGVRSLTMGKAGLAVMAGSVYSNKQQELLSRGCTAQQAKTGGFFSALFEVLTEYVSVDNIVSGLKSGVKGAVNTTGKGLLKKAVKDTLFQMGCEASEEAISEILNTITYAVNASGENQFQENVSLYIKNGFTEEEARKKAFEDLLGEVGMSFVGGGISGLFFGTEGSVANAIGVQVYQNSAMNNGQLNDLITSDINADMKTIGMSSDDIGVINDFRSQPVDWVTEEGTKAFVDTIGKVHEIANKLRTIDAENNLARQQSAQRLQNYVDSLMSSRESYQNAYQNGDIKGMRNAINAENKALNDYANAKNIESAKEDARKAKRTQRTESLMSDLSNAMGEIYAYRESEKEYQKAKVQQIEVEDTAERISQEVKTDKGLAGQVYKTDTEQAAKVRIEQKQIIDSMDTLRAEISKIAREFGIRSLNSDGRFNRAMLNLQQKMVEGQDYTEELNEVMKSVMNAQVSYTSDGQFDSEMADDIRNRLKGTFFNRIGADGKPVVSKVIFEQTRGLWRNGTGSQLDTWYDELRGQYPGLPEMQNPEDIALYLHDIKKSVGKTYDSLQNFLSAKENQTGSTASDVSSRIAQVIADYTEANIDAISDLQNTANIYNNVRTQENNVIEEIVNGQERNDISVDRQGRQYEDTAVGSDGRGFEESDTDIIRLEEGSRSVSQSHNESSREALASIQERINESFGDNEIEEVNEIGKGTFDAIEQSKADIGNRQIRFFKYKDGDATKSRPHGVNDGNFIFVEDSGDTTVNLFNTMHEVMHDKVQAKYADVVINAENGQAVLDSYRQHTGKDGTDAEVLEELICDIYGNLSVMQTLNKKIEPSVFVDADMESAFKELQMQVMMSMLEGENAVESEDEEVNRKNAIQPNFSTTDASKYTEIDPEHSAYYQAIADGDEETQAEMVREAAEENGYIVRAYHGTPNGQFREFDSSYFNTGNSDGGMLGEGFYFTTKKNVADYYTQGTDNVYDVYLKANNGFDVNKFGNFGFDEYDFDYIIEMYKSYPNIIGEYPARVVENGAYGWRDTTLNDLFDGIDLNGDSLFVEEQLENKYANYESDSRNIYKDKNVTDNIKSLGYDSLWLGENGDQILIWDSNNIKSADNIAYDENGKVIPLNERFNSGTNDIYFSTTTFLTPEQEEQRYIQQRTNQARTNAERTIENKRQANQVYEEVVMGTEYGFTPDDIIKKVAERMYGNKNRADIQQVLSMTERMLLRNGYNVGGKFADNKMADIAADSLLWQKLKAAAGQSPLRIFQDIAAYRDTKLADQEARTKAIIQNAKSSQEFSDDYFMYKEQQLMKKNRYMIEASKVVDSIDANDTESILAQMLGEGIIGKEQMQNAVSDGKHVFIPVLDGAIVTDKKGRIRWMADGESLVTYSDNYYQKLTKLRAEIDNIRKNNPDNADALIAEAKKKSGLPLETPGAYKSVKTADGWKLVDALGETIVSVNGKKKFSADKVTSLVDSLSKIYAEMYDDVQGSLVTNGYAPIGKIERYFPHFTKQRDGFAGFMDYLHSEDLPIDIAGLTETFKPGKPWARNLLERLGDRTDYDAVHGFNGYLNSVTDVIYLTPVIQRFRQLENTLRTGSVDADEYGTNQNNSNFVVWLHDYTNQLANKKHSLDRGAETMAGRKVYTAMSKVMGATGKSAIAFNFRTGLSNFASFAQGAGIINPKYTARAVADVIQKVDDGLDESIPFVYNRVNQADELTTGTRSKIASKAQYYGFLWMKICDDFSTKAIARAKYYELIDKGYSNERAINETSKWCTNLFADRSKGSRATIFTSKMLAPLTQFQLEPYNQLWHYTDIHNATVREQAMKAIEDNNGQIEGIDFNAIADVFSKQSIAKKDIEKYLGRFLSTTLFGMLMRLVTGRDVTWNLGGMVADVIGGAKKNGAEGAVDALKDDILDNIPFSSVVEKLINITNGDYTATNNPITASVSNIVNSAKGFAQGAESGDVLKMIESGTYYMPGGSQLRKSMGGIDAFNKGGAYTAKGDKLRYPIEQNVPNFVKAVLFGKGSFQPRNYDYSTDLLGTEETKAYRQLVDNGVDPQEAYDFLLNDYSTYARQDESTTQAAILASGLDERTQDLIAQALGIELGTEEEVRQDLADFDAETEKKHGSGKIKDSTYEKRKTAIDYYMEMLY